MIDVHIAGLGNTKHWKGAMALFNGCEERDWVQNASLTSGGRFPIREYGMNWQSQPLQLHEIEQMRDDPLIVARIVGSYKLMLDFYGMQLVDEPTGLLARTEGYEERYDNLIREFSH